MAILCDAETRLVIQGLGRMGRFHAGLSRDYGTRVVAGVRPGKGGEDVDGIPVYDTVREAVRDAGANASAIFVPAPGAADAILEAADAGIALVACITEVRGSAASASCPPRSPGPAPSAWSRARGR
jgi:succinyl-CoA synthetase alpha subunit